MNAGTKVLFSVATTGENVRGESVVIPAGSTGTVVNVINELALYVKVNGRKLVVWTDDVDLPSGAPVALPTNFSISCGAANGGCFIPATHVVERTAVCGFHLNNR